MPDPTLIARLESGVLPAHHLVDGWVDEAISQPTRAQVLIAADEPFDAAAAIGGDAKIELVDAEGEALRKFHLVISGITFVAERSQRLVYRIDFAHQLAQLALRSDVRMFQEKDVKDIVSAVLDGAGVASDHVEWSLTRTPRKRVYCVQYRESDLAFVSRLLEDEGIFYLPKDGDDATIVSLVDGTSAFTPLDDDEVRLTDGTETDGIDTFELEHRLTTDVAVVADWNYETPTVKLEATEKAADPPNGSNYLPWTGHTTPAEGKALAKIRAEELAAGKKVGFGRSVRMDFMPGRVFKLTEATQASLCAKYVLRRVRHVFRVNTHEPTPSDLPDTYYNEFECHPEPQPFRPARVTPKARAYGSQSVVVTGASGEEIHTEKLARMKGKFFWDRVGKNDDTSSPWMRLAQLPLGGSLTLARVGWEMTIQHLQGDPDRPIAVSRTYDASKPSPYGYPAAGSKLALQTASSPGGGKSNEIRMSDGAGGMEFFMNASKDMSETVLNDKNEKVDVDAKLDVGVDSTNHVGANQKVTIGAAQTTDIGAEATLTVKGNRTKTVGAAETVNINGKNALQIKGGDTETIGAGFTQVAGLEVSRTTMGSQTLTVGASSISAAGKDVSLTCIGTKSETVGAAKIIMAASKATETVYGALALTVGGVSLTLAASDHKAEVKGVAALTVGGAAVYNAAGQLLLKGSTVKILVGGMANFLGGGGIMNVTPGSVAFVGMVTLDASGEIQLTGSPNLVG
jgi:type VI secretion system secreted protein VgrG